MKTQPTLSVGLVGKRITLRMDVTKLVSQRDSREEKTDIAQSSKKAASICVSNTLDEEYNSKHKKVGIALIFNHEVFIEQDRREATNLDRDRLEGALQSFGFDVRTYNNLDLEELLDTLNDVAREDHSENDCLVIVVMSHGKMGEVCARDTIYPVDSLWKPFLGNNCKSLINKPKIVFVQACRGKQGDLPVSYVPMCVNPSERTKPVNYFIPTTADLLVFYSSFDGHPSFRGSSGSWFIQSLCLYLEDAAVNSPKGTDLLRLLTRVNRKVAYDYQVQKCKKPQYQNTKEMPTFVSTLTKIFYLKVKRN